MYESAGCDLMKQPGEIANWLVEWHEHMMRKNPDVIAAYLGAHA